MPEILHRITIDAPADTVFDAIATDEGIKHWWTDDSSSATAAGEMSEFRFMNGDIVFRMHVDVYEPGHKLAWQFAGDYDEWEGTTITWEFEPTSDGKTVLSLKHANWPTTEGEYPNCNTSWGHLLHVIRDYAEGKGTDLMDSGRSS